MAPVHPAPVESPTPGPTNNNKDATPGLQGAASPPQASSSSLTQQNEIQHQPGTQVLGYTLLRLLGTGAGGSVFLARHEDTSTPCAIKVQKLTTKTRRAVQREGHIHMSLKHPHIVRSLEVFERGIYHYMVMEYTDSDLLQWLRSNVHPTRPLKDVVAFPLFHQVISALRFCHMCHIAHRDIKPQNVLLHNGVLKITDFGLAHCTADHDGSRHLMRVPHGSPYYCAPEILLRQPYDGELVDVWGAGLVLWAMLVGSIPHAAATPKEATERIISRDLEPPATLENDTRELLSGMLCRDPSLRWRFDDVFMNTWWSRMCAECDLPALGTHRGAHGSDFRRRSHVVGRLPSLSTPLTPLNARSAAYPSLRPHGSVREEDMLKGPKRGWGAHGPALPGVPSRNSVDDLHNEWAVARSMTPSSVIGGRELTIGHTVAPSSPVIASSPLSPLSPPRSRLGAVSRWSAHTLLRTYSGRSEASFSYALAPVPQPSPPTPSTHQTSVTHSGVTAGSGSSSITPSATPPPGVRNQISPTPQDKKKKKIGFVRRLFKKLGRIRGNSSSRR